MPPPLAAATVMRLTAGVDGHSGVYPFEVGFHAVALHLYDFGGAIHVVDAPDPGLIGLEVVAIDDTPIGDAIATVVPYAAHDNDTTISVVVPMLLGTPEVLRAAGVARSDDGITYVLRAPDGVTAAVTPEALTWGEFDEHLGGIPVGLPADDRMMSLARRDEAFWWSPSIRHRVPAVQLGRRGSGGVTINDITHGVGRALDAGADRLVIDLRHNNGGNNRTYRPLLQLLVSHPALAEPGALLVLIGRQTFSAATNFATELDARTPAVFLGEPTGGRPNLYADVRTVVLPNSGMPVEVSSHYIEIGGPDDLRDAITPEVPVDLTIEAFLAGVDPALERGRVPYLPV